MRKLGLIAVALAFLAGGCGSDPPRLTQAEFTRQANAVCSRYATLVGGLTSGITPGNVAQAEASVTQALPVIRAGHDELRALRPPAGLQDAYDRLLDDSDRQLDAVEKLEDALQKNDLDGAISAVKTLASADVAQERADAAQVGLSRCGI